MLYLSQRKSKRSKDMIKNSEIRNQAKKSGVCLWQIAEELKMQDSNFSRLLRHELSAEKKQQILAIIEKLSRE